MCRKRIHGRRGRPDRRERSTACVAPLPAFPEDAGGFGAGALFALSSPVSPNLPQSGENLAGKYAIEHVVGEGGMCVIFAARHLQLQQRVAIKMLRPDVSHRSEAYERFMREGRAATRIRSEYCVRILDVDVLPSGEPYIVMEHLDGSDFEALILANGPSPVTPAVDYILQASEAIAEAHSLGIVHRDLKPANLFSTRRADGTPWIKVLDFGISKVPPRLSQRETRLTGGEMVMGSPQYMSPEQLRATRDVDGRTDIWSLGAILHELLSGQPPFVGDTVTAVCASIIQDEPPRLSTLREDVPAGLDSVVRRCLAKDRDQRFATMAELAEALAEFASPAGRASVQRIVGILSSVADSPPGGALVRPSDETAWGSTDRSWRTGTRARRGVLNRLAMATATLAVLAVAGFAGASYAKAHGVAMPPTLTSAVTRVGSLMGDPAPAASVAPPSAPPAATIDVIPAVSAPVPSPPPVATADSTAARAAVTGGSPAPSTAAPAGTTTPLVALRPSPARASQVYVPPPRVVAPPAPLPSPAAYLPPPPPEEAPRAATPAPTTPPSAAPASPDQLFDERK